jgi:hypothetical protein
MRLNKISDACRRAGICVCLYMMNLVVRGIMYDLHVFICWYMSRHMLGMCVNNVYMCALICMNTSFAAA